ncbi:MAG: ABC transporter substrate-binding protein [Betaproteobacteria bacterium]|nr:ABC transporter substrate-binding protein [Betaproteobacteria bacterium]
MDQAQFSISRRRLLKGVGGTAGLAAAGALHAPFVIAQPAKLKIGLMLPYSGTFGPTGISIDNAFRLYVAEKGGKLGGRELEYVVLDDESEPAKAADNAGRLVNRDKVDVLVGTVHSGVQMGVLKVVRESGTLTIIPNAGVGAATGALCAPNIFRSSFSNWQMIHPLGKVMWEKGHKTAVWISWKYAAGEERFASFKEGYEKLGGKIVKELWLPFPNVEFQALLTEIAAAKPDAVACFFAGGGAVKFVKDYDAAGLKGKIPLYGDALTEGTLQAQGSSAQGIFTTMHYADGLTFPRDKAFRLAYAKAYKLQPDVYALGGYDAAQMLDVGLSAVKGDIKAQKQIIAAIEKATIDSPRGKFTLSKAHNPVQDIYLRQVVGEQNKFVSIAWKALADPARGCNMA